MYGAVSRHSPPFSFLILLYIPLCCSLLCSAASASAFTEVMPDPPGADNNLEFVELLVNLAPQDVLLLVRNGSLVFGDAASNDTLTLKESHVLSGRDEEYMTNCMYSEDAAPPSYGACASPDFPDNSTGNATNDTSAAGPTILLIVEEGYVFANASPLNASCIILGAGATIGDNLGNTADDLRLWSIDTEHPLALFSSYAVSGCAAGGGCSLHAENTTGNTSGDTSTVWVTGPPSPCVIDVVVDTGNFSDVGNASLPQDGNGTFSGNSSNTTGGNTTGNSTGNATTEEPCLANFSVILSSEYLDEGDALKFKPVIDAERGSTFWLTYWFEDIFGVRLKAPITTTNKNEKSYTPKVPSGERDLVLRLLMDLELSCGSSAHLERTIIVKGEEATESEDDEGTAATVAGKVSSSRALFEKKEVLVVEAPSSALLGENLTVVATLFNDGLLDELFLVWSYLYIGSVSYSGEREANMQELIIGPGEEKTVVFSVQPTATEPGAYKLKTKAVRAGRKTPYDVTYDIELREPKEEGVLPWNTTAATTEEDDAEEDEEILGFSAASGRSEKVTGSKDSKGRGERGEVTGAATVDVLYDSEPRVAWILRNSAWIAVLLAGALFGLSTLLSRRRAQSGGLPAHPEAACRDTSPESALSLDKQQ